MNSLESLFWNMLPDWAAVIVVTGIGILLFSVISGIATASHNVFNSFKKETIEKLKSCGYIMGLMVFYAFVGGVVATILAHQGILNKEYVNIGFLIGGVIGCIIGISLNRIEQKSTEKTRLFFEELRVRNANYAHVAIFAIVIYGAIAGWITGEIFGVNNGWIVGMGIGVITGAIFALTGKSEYSNGVIILIFMSIVIVGAIKVGITLVGVYGGIFVVIVGVYGGIFGGLLVIAIVESFFGVLSAIFNIIFSSISKFLAPPITKLFALLTRPEIICGKCLCYSSPSKSRYENGIRYCGNLDCNKVIEKTKEKGKVIVTFGDYNLSVGNRKFILNDPDFSNKNNPIDVSEVYIETKTAKELPLMQFITFIHNHPPKHGVESIKVFYNGRLNDLGANLRNLILLKFKSVVKEE